LSDGYSLSAGSFNGVDGMFWIVLCQQPIAIRSSGADLIFNRNSSKQSTALEQENDFVGCRV
jgi:hypothetical protein